MKTFGFFLSGLFFALFAHGQQAQFFELLNDPDAKFSETQAAAERYFEEVGTGKGTGWKVWKRWEYRMETRLTEDGRQSFIHTIPDEFERYMKEQESQRRTSTAGDWNLLGPIQQPAVGNPQPNGMGRVNCIAFHPTNANTIYIGAASGGFWETTDGGVTWTDKSVGLQYLSISSILVHPTNTSTIYIGTGDRDAGDAPGRGVYRSTDGGTTWNAWNTGMGNRVCYEILMHPTNSNIMLCSTNGRIWRTTNGGANWTSQYSGGENFKDLAFKPGDPNTVYAASNDYYRSTDNGVTWTQVTSGLTAGSVQRYALAVSSADPNYVYLLGGNGGGMVALYRSTDSGQSFSVRSTSPNIFGYDVTGGTGSQAWYDIVMIGDDSDRDHITMGGVNLWESFDGGSNWSIVAHWVGGGGNPAVHADQHVLEYSPHNGDLYNGNDGGVYYTSDGGANWNEISSGLSISQIYKIGQSQTVKDLVINGYQDNGTAIYYGAAGWVTELGGDGMECAIDYTDENYMYAEYYYGALRRSANGGVTFSDITGGISETGAWVTPYKLHPTDPNTMLTGMRNVWRTNDVKAANPTWTQISNLGGTSTIRDLAIAPSNPDYVYLSRAGSQNFWRSTNATSANPTWTDLDASLPGSSRPRDIEIDPNDPTHLWIAYGNNIYESTNAGVTFTDVSGTLPNIPCNTIVYDQYSTNDALYIGMDIGVYYLDNSLANPIPFLNGIPNVEVTELEIYYDPTCRGDDMLRAATYGRGLWESDLRDPGTLVPIACFVPSPTTVCEGMTVLLEDRSAYNPTSWNWTISPASFAFVGGTNANDQNPLVQFSAPGTYTITLNSTNVNGTDSDTQVNVVTVTSGALTLPQSEDWEGEALCATTSNCGATTCNLTTWWSNETGDDIDWRVDEDGTPSTNTGPAVDFNPGTTTGNYVYTEASSCFGRTAELISDCIDLRSATNPELVFAYHMAGSEMGSLHLDIFENGAWTNDIMATISGDQGTAWLTRTVSLLPYVGQVVQLRFRGITGAGFQSDMALDDLIIRESSVLDVLDLEFAGMYVEGQGNQLTWLANVSEAEHHFQLEKKLPGGDFVELTRMESEDGKGQYQFLDTQPFQGINYYRLKVVETDGEIHDGGIVEIYSDWQEESIMLYPNPARGSVSLRVQSQHSGPVPVQVINMMGQVVFTHHIDLNGGTSEKTFDLSRLGKGVYYFRFKGRSVKMVLQ